MVTTVFSVQCPVKVTSGDWGVGVRGVPFLFLVPSGTSSDAKEQLHAGLHPTWRARLYWVTWPTGDEMASRTPLIRRSECLC